MSSYMHWNLTTELGHCLYFGRDAYHLANGEIAHRPLRDGIGKLQTVEQVVELLRYMARTHGRKAQIALEQLYRREDIGPERIARDVDLARKYVNAIGAASLDAEEILPPIVQRIDLLETRLEESPPEPPAGHS